MKIKKIIRKFKNLILEFKKHNKLFIHDNPKISDSEYDQSKKNIFKLQDDYPNLKKIEDITKIVGAAPTNKFKKVKHLLPMLSLSNAFNKKDMEDFIKKINNFLNVKK